MRIRSFIVFVLIAAICMYFWDNLGFIIAIPVAIFINVLISTFEAMNYCNKSKKEYDSMISDGCSKEDALMKISKKSHPELGEKIHSEIINRFNDIHLLTNFIKGALPNKKITDDYALDILYHTTIRDYGGGRCRVITDWAKYVPSSAEEKIDDKYSYLFSRGRWKELGENVLKKIVENFEGIEDKKFVEFVQLSEHYKLLENNFLSLAQMSKDLSHLLSLMATTMQNCGGKIVEQYEKNNDTDYLKAGMSCYYISTVLNKNHLTGYVSLSGALAIEGEKDKAINTLEKLKERYLALQKKQR
ncbi:MAG: hypothetical protein U9R38_07740 [Candidatus Margulisiibacteriota bacterium]|nr:hypothetical protein [Candidatus Margulisiibacteriota bacterium]